MRYKIEYLLETTDQKSVCYTKFGQTGNLDAVGRQAFESALAARRLGATGFLIRDLHKAGEIVALETFDHARN